MTNQMSTEKKQEQLDDALWDMLEQLNDDFGKHLYTKEEGMLKMHRAIMPLIAQERADAASETAREARVDELLTAIEQLKHIPEEDALERMEARLAALTTDTTKGAKQ